MSKTEDVYEAVLHDEDDLAHYGRLGMKWYQHIFGEYQGAAKYAEKGVKKLEKAKERDRFNGGTQSEKTKQLANKVKAVKESAEEAKKKYDAKQKRQDEENEIKEQKAHEQKILDLAHGSADWRKASAKELLEAIEHLSIEKQYKELRDDVSGSKAKKEVMTTGAKSVANKAGDITAELVKKAAENWGKDADFERSKRVGEHNRKMDKDLQKETVKEINRILSGKNGASTASTSDIKAATERLKAIEDLELLRKKKTP